MLTEIPLSKVRQIPGEPRRRWFHDDFFDLIVWSNQDTNILGFQLCYDIARDQRALTWRNDSGFSHNRVNAGKDILYRHKMPPVLIFDGIFNRETIIQRFKRESTMINKTVASFV